MVELRIVLEMSNMPKDLLAQRPHSALPCLMLRGQAILGGLLLSGVPLVTPGNSHYTSG